MNTIDTPAVRSRTAAPRPAPAPARLPAWADALVRTDDSRTSVLLRLTLALVIFPHGAQKVLGWFGGYGLEGTMGYFTGTLGIPPALGALAIAAEFLGPIGLAAGLLSRVAALGIASVMVGAVLTSHLPHGFFMNWDGALPAGSEGYEFHILVLSVAVAIIVKGSGAWSLDRALSRRG